MLRLKFNDKILHCNIELNSTNKELQSFLIRTSRMCWQTIKVYCLHELKLWTRSYAMLSPFSSEHCAPWHRRQLLGCTGLIQQQFNLIMWLETSQQLQQRNLEMQALSINLLLCCAFCYLCARIVLLNSRPLTLFTLTLIYWRGGGNFTPPPYATVFAAIS